MYGEAIGATLFEHVVGYAALGHHRTGTDNDEATRRWFGRRLREIGARVEELQYRFPRYDVRAELVTAGGRAVDALPVWYAGEGAVEAAAPSVVELPLSGLLPLADLDEVIAGAPGDGPVVVVVDGPGGRLVAMNREPIVRPGRLAVLVAGRDRDALEDGPSRLTMGAQLVPGASATVVGSWGEAGGDPVVVTTPLTGWFACAGERGTGIAIALEVAARLASRRSVLVVGTTGHELEFLGAREYLADRGSEPGAVLHLGAGVAAGDPDPTGTVRLGAARLAMTNADDPDALFDALARAGFTPGFDPPWPGEGELWREQGAPVLSLIGGFDRFHTADDLPESVTSPDLLESVSAAVATVADLLAD